jgi:hypothetical protein
MLDIVLELRAAAASLSERRFTLALTNPELIYLLGSEQNDATTNGPVMVTATYRHSEVVLAHTVGTQGTP